MNFLLHQIHGGLHWNLQKFKHLNLRLNSKALFVNFWQLHRRVWDFRIEASSRDVRAGARGVRIRHQSGTTRDDHVYNVRAGRIRYSVWYQCWIPSLLHLPISKLFYKPETLDL